MQELLDY